MRSNTLVLSVHETREVLKDSQESEPVMVNVDDSDLLGK